MSDTRRASSFSFLVAALAVAGVLALAALAPARAHAAEITASDGSIDTQTELAEAISQANAATEDSVIKLGGSIEVTASGIAFNIHNEHGALITIDGDDGAGGSYAISGNVAVADGVSKMFAVYSDAAFANVAIENSGANGRCIDTRAAVSLSLDNVELKAQGSGNTQPLTIGGEENGTTLDVRASTIDATPAGYGIIVFVKSDITVSQGSDITGYAALYLKAGSDGSVVNLTEAALHGVNSFDEASSNFGTVVVEAADVTVNVEDGAITADATSTDVQSIFSVRAKNLAINVAGASELTYEGTSRVFSYVSGFGATDVSMAIAGGTFAIDDSFTEDMLKAYLVDGATAGELKDGLITVTPVHNCPSAGFTDVDQNAWYHEPVDFVIENGLMGQGMGDKFLPLEDASRAMFVTVLWRYAGEPEVAANAAIAFPDVKESAWYYDAVTWAASEGVISGYAAGPSKGMFGPNDGVTREQMAVILHRFVTVTGEDVSLASASIGDFPDASKVSTWAVDGMGWAVENGIITGVAGKYLAPADIAQRAQVAAVIARLDALAGA